MSYRYATRTFLVSFIDPPWVSSGIRIYIATVESTAMNHYHRTTQIANDCDTIR